MSCCPLENQVLDAYLSTFLGKLLGVNFVMRFGMDFEILGVENPQKSSRMAFHADASYRRRLGPRKC